MTKQLQNNFVSDCIGLPVYLSIRKRGQTRPPTLWHLIGLPHRPRSGPPSGGTVAIYFPGMLSLYYM